MINQIKSRIEVARQRNALVKEGRAFQQLIERVIPAKIEVVCFVVDRIYFKAKLLKPAIRNFRKVYVSALPPNVSEADLISDETIGDLQLMLLRVVYVKRGPAGSIWYVVERNALGSNINAA